MGRYEWPVQMDVRRRGLQRAKARRTRLARATTYAELASIAAGKVEAQRSQASWGDGCARWRQTRPPMQARSLLRLIETLLWRKSV